MPYGCILSEWWILLDFLFDSEAQFGYYVDFIVF